MATKTTKPDSLAADQVLINGQAVTVLGALARNLTEFEALRAAEKAWTAEQLKPEDEQDLHILAELLMLLVRDPELITPLSVIEALRLWLAASRALAAADAALLSDFGVTAGESVAPSA